MVSQGDLQDLGLPQKLICKISAQSYKYFPIVNYDPRVIIWANL